MLALIAGQGALPARLIEAHKPTPLICELEGFPSGLSEEPITFRVETLGSFLTDLTARGVQDVCFAGAIQRPALDPSLIDTATMPMVPKMMQALQAGDDGALRIVISFFEEAGFRVRAAHDLMPGLLPEAGIPTDTHPSERDRVDVDRAAAVSAATASQDVGQALVVAAGQVIALETLGGTDWMLDSIAGDNRPDGPSGGLLYKAPKAGQDRRIDLPLIGPDTVARAKTAGLGGIVIEAGGVMVLDFEDTLRAANDAGLFLWVRPA